MGKFKNWLADQKERREMRAMERFNLREANRNGRRKFGRRRMAI